MLTWYRVASHLRIPVQELRERITQSEFVDWIVYLELEEKRHTPEHYYLAQIAAEIRRGLVENPNTVKIKPFLLNYDAPTQTESDGATRARKSKEAWLAFANIKTETN